MSIYTVHGRQEKPIPKPVNAKESKMNGMPVLLPNGNTPLVSAPNESGITTKKRSVNDFQFLECIGEGSYSKVYRALSNKNMHTYAVKVLNKQHIHKEKKRKYVTIEKNTLNVLGKHPGIVTLYYTFQDSKSLYFVIDFALNGELLTLIHNLGSLSLELTRYYTIELIDTITYIHSKGIIHRDLKPENILLNNNWNLMITDLGAAKFINETGTDSNNDSASSTNNIESSGSFVGTAEYISPELLRYNQSSCGSDFWALGCIIYQMIVGKPPFKAKNEYQTFEKIVDLDYSFPDPREYYIPSYVVNLIKDLLAEDPNERLGADKIATYSWFKSVDWDNKDLIWGKVPLLRAYNPAEVAAKHNVRFEPLTPPSSVSNSNTAKSVQSVDYEKNALKKQIINAQSNTHLMNKVNNRINSGKIAYKPQTAPTSLKTTSDQLKGLKVETKRAVHKTSIKYPIYSNAPKFTTAPIASSPTSKAFPASTPVVKSPNILPAAKMVNNKSNNTIQSTVNQKDAVRKAKRTSQVSFSSLMTNGESSKSVIIKSDADKGLLKMSPAQNSPANLIAKPLTPVNSSTTKTTPVPASTLAAKKQQNQLNSSPMVKRNSHNSIIIPKQRIPSSEASAAAGAIGTLLTHNRTMNSVNSTAAQHKQLLQNRQKQMINPVLLDKKIPNVITSKLMYQETILKLDNIYKSEINHKTNQFTVKGETLDHSTLESIIKKYERDLEKDLKSCVMVVTSFARLFIYELNDGFHLNKPQSAIQMQAQDFYQKVIEIKLTNRNVSLYDYEFDEDMHEGYLILELANVNKLIFLSAWDRNKLIKGGINSNVRIGFKLNDSETWINTFLKARRLLKKRESAAQNLKHIGKLDPAGSAQKSSTPSNMQSFRSKLGTRLRSVSGSNQKDMRAFHRVPSDTANKEHKANVGNNSESHSNSLIDSVKELTHGVQVGFKRDGDEYNAKTPSPKSPIEVTNDKNTSIYASHMTSRLSKQPSVSNIKPGLSKINADAAKRATAAATIAFSRKG